MLRLATEWSSNVYVFTLYNRCRFVETHQIEASIAMEAVNSWGPIRLLTH